MKISQLIHILQNHKDCNGDIELYVAEGDGKSSWVLPITKCQVEYKALWPESKVKRWYLNLIGY